MPYENQTTRRIMLMKMILPVLQCAGYTIGLSLIMLVAFSAIVVAQPGFPSVPAAVPIDGGLLMLAAGGGVYAYKKLKSRNTVD